MYSFCLASAGLQEVEEKWHTNNSMAKWHHILECQLQLPHNLNQECEWRSGESIRNIHYLEMIIIQVPSNHIYKNFKVLPNIL